MRPIRTFVAAAVLVLVAACATPGAVKELSTAQMAAFDQVILAVQQQSQALILAADKIKTIKQAEIDSILAKNQQRLAKAPSDAIGKNLASYTGLVETNIAQKQRLQDQVNRIGAKSDELVAAITKMHEVQKVIHGYLDSEDAGDSLLKSVLNETSIGGALTSLNSVVSDAMSAAGDLQSVIKGIQ